MKASSSYSLFDAESIWSILLRIAPPPVGRVTHRDDEQVAIPTFSDTCHVVIPPVSLSTAEIL